MTLTLDLSGRHVLVTGAAGGLGKAIALLAAEAGAAVALSDLPRQSLEEAREEVTAAGGHAIALGADLTTRAAAREVVDRVVRELGAIDGLVACAGVMQTKPLLDLDEDDWRRVLRVNLDGTFFVMQAAGAAMRGGGAMVLLSSVAGRSGRPLAAHYSASKTAVLSLTKSAAAALAPNIRVNAICPGVFMTEMWQGIIRERAQLFGEKAGERYLEEVRSAAPLGRPGDPRELASVAIFLLSGASSYITGQAVNVDGGLEMD